MLTKLRTSHWANLRRPAPWPLRVIFDGFSVRCGPVDVRFAPQATDILGDALCRDGPGAVLIPASVSSSHAGTAARFRAVSNSFARGPAEAGFWPVMRRPSTTT